MRLTKFKWSKDCEPSGIEYTRFDDEMIMALRQGLPEYLAARGVELRQNGTRLVGKCPVHDDRSPSFAVFGARQEVCGCHPCGFTGDVFDVSIWLGRSSSFTEAVQDVADALGIHPIDSPSGCRAMASMTPQRIAKPIQQSFALSDTDQEKISVARLAFSDALDGGRLDVLAAELGIPLPCLHRCSMGQSSLGWWNHRLAYIYPQGMKVRNPAGDKYRFFWECGKALAPWRMDWLKPGTRTVYLTEGESDCIALCAAGLEADGTAVCVASPGTSFSREWARLFRGKRVVICFDSDAAGRAATATVAAILKGHASETLTWKGIASHE